MSTSNKQSAGGSRTKAILRATSIVVLFGLMLVPVYYSYIRYTDSINTQTYAIAVSDANGERKQHEVTDIKTVSSDSANNATASSAFVDLAKQNFPAPVTNKYFAYEAEPGTNNMGPSIVVNSADDGVIRLTEKLVRDSLYSSLIQESLINGRNIELASIYKRAEIYAKDDNLRYQDAIKLIGSIDSVYLSDFGNTAYYSSGMVTGNNPSVMPEITSLSMLREMKQTLVVKFNNGHVLFLRVECDLQPSWAASFRKVPVSPNAVENPPKVPPAPYKPPTPPVPPVPPAPPSTTTPPPPTTTTLTPPPSTTTPPPPPVTTTPPTPDSAKKPDAGPSAPEGHGANAVVTDNKEVTLPTESNPVNSNTPVEAPAPELAAPNQNVVPSDAPHTETANAEAGNPGVAAVMGGPVADPDLQPAPAQPQVDASQNSGAQPPAVEQPVQQPAQPEQPADNASANEGQPAPDNATAEIELMTVSKSDPRGLLIAVAMALFALAFFALRKSMR